MVYSDARGRIVDYLGIARAPGGGHRPVGRRGGGLRLRSGAQRFYEGVIGFTLPDAVQRRRRRARVVRRRRAAVPDRGRRAQPRLGTAVRLPRQLRRRVAEGDGGRSPPGTSCRCARSAATEAAGAVADVSNSCAARRPEPCACRGARARTTRPWRRRAGRARVAANVHGSSGSTSNSNRSSSRVSTPAATQSRGDADGDEAQRLAEHQAEHRRRRRAEGHADADFLRPLPHRVRHHAVDADRRERERHEREHAEQHRNRAWTRDRAADDIFERADVDRRFRVPSRERFP